MLLDRRQCRQQEMGNISWTEIRIKYEIVPSDTVNGGKNALAISFKMNDWCDGLQL